MHDAIYNTEYGIKSTPTPTQKATDVIYQAIRELGKMGCRAVILGCTELPLVFPDDRSLEGIGLIDPTEVLAVELIRNTEPEKLIEIPAV